MCNFVFQETDAFSEMYNYSIKKTHKFEHTGKNMSL